MKAINYGALSGFRMLRLGQDAWADDTMDTTTTTEIQPNLTDENFNVDTGRPSDTTPADSGSSTPTPGHGSTTTSNGPSQSPAAASSSPGFFQQVGNFFSSLFTPSNISAAAKIARGNPAAPKPGAALPAAVATSAFSDPGTLLVLGGITAAAVVGVSLLTRKSD